MFFTLIIFHLKDRSTSRIQFLNGLQTKEYFCLDNQHHFLNLSNVYGVPLTQLLNQPVPTQYVNSHGSSAHHTSSTIKLNIYSKTYLVEFEYCSYTPWLRWIRNCQTQFSESGVAFLLLILLCNYCAAPVGSWNSSRTSSMCQIVSLINKLIFLGKTLRNYSNVFPQPSVTTKKNFMQCRVFYLLETHVTKP